MKFFIEVQDADLVPVDLSEGEVREWGTDLVSVIIPDDFSLLEGLKQGFTLEQILPSFPDLGIFKASETRLSRQNLLSKGKITQKGLGVFAALQQVLFSAGDLPNKEITLSLNGDKVFLV